MVCKIMFWFSLFLFYDSLISCHNLLAILSRGYVCCRFISFIFIVCSSVDVRPLTPGLGPSHKILLRSHYFTLPGVLYLLNIC